MTFEQRTPLETDLATATLKALQGSYRDLNHSLFGDALRPPVLKLNATSQVRVGRWDPEHRCIEISEQLILDRGFGAAIEVLKHEMAHQFVHEVLTDADESPHGKVFRSVCVERGIKRALS